MIKKRNWVWQCDLSLLLATNLPQPGPSSDRVIASSPLSCCLASRYQAVTRKGHDFFFPSGISQTNSSHNSNNKQPSYYSHFVLGAPPDRRQGLHLFITSSQLCAPISHTALAAALQGWRIPSVHSSGMGCTRSCSPCTELCLHTHCCHQGDAPLAINSRTRAHPHPSVAQFAMKWQTVHKLKANAEELGIFSKLGTTVNNWAVSRTLISLIPYTEATV